MDWECHYKFEPIKNVKNIGEKTDNIEMCSLYERTTHFENVNGIKKIIYFAKAWLYYPKMQRYLDKNYGTKLKATRFQYSVKHCKHGRLVEE